MAHLAKYLQITRSEKVMVMKVKGGEIRGKKEVLNLSAYKFQIAYFKLRKKSNKEEKRCL
jgi:hypothetical protein